MILVRSQMDGFTADIPPLRRVDIAAVYRLAAARMVADALNGNAFEAHPELAVVKTAGQYAVRYGMPMPWAAPLVRDVMGLMPSEFAEWDRLTPLVGAGFVLRALAHAVENGDL
ncbi:MAG: hypothetical protein ACRDVE_18090 [Actinocrinis sp.]